MLLHVSDDLVSFLMDLKFVDNSFVKDGLPLCSHSEKSGFLAIRPIVIWSVYIITLVNVYVDLLVFTRIDGTS